jgi:site-specific DNA-cytosine methylase
MSVASLLMAGFPCQDLSIGGKGAGLSGARSGLFYDALRVHEMLNPDYFLYENVASMKRQDRDIISKEIGVEPIEINSNLVSAQNRRRLYWTNIPYAGLPEDRGVLLKHILETNVDPKYLAGQKLLDNYAGGNQLNPDYKSQANTIHDHNKKSPCIAAGTHGYAIGYVDAEHFKYGDMEEVMVNSKKWRKLSPLECERLQTLPDNYTNHVSNTQRYKMIGNGYTVDVIGHILKGLPEDIDTVYSLFDGCSMGQMALIRIGKLTADYRYFSSEVDKYAIAVTQANFPETIQLGNIQNVTLCDITKKGRWDEDFSENSV